MSAEGLVISVAREMQEIIAEAASKWLKLMRVNEACVHIVLPCVCTGPRVPHQLSKKTFSARSTSVQLPSGLTTPVGLPKQPLQPTVTHPLSQLNGCLCGEVLCICYPQVHGEYVLGILSPLNKHHTSLEISRPRPSSSFCFSAIDRLPSAMTEPLNDCFSSSVAKDQQLDSRSFSARTPTGSPVAHARHMPGTIHYP